MESTGTQIMAGKVHLWQGNEDKHTTCTLKAHISLTYNDNDKNYTNQYCYNNSINKFSLQNDKHNDKTHLIEEIQQTNKQKQTNKQTNKHKTKASKNLCSK